MLTTLRNAFKVKDVRKKLLYTFIMLVIIRFGSNLPIPGVNTTYFKDFFAKQTGDAFGFFNAITGGSFESLSVLALSITPYITSSIIIQLLTIAIPALEELQQDGEDGRKKIVEYTRYLTVALALLQSSAMAIGFGRQGLLIHFGIKSVVVAVVTMTAGSAFLMWMGERITFDLSGKDIIMNKTFKFSALALSALLALTACNQKDTAAKDAPAASAASNAAADASAIGSTAQQASYAMGVDIGRSLKQMKDQGTEIDLKVFTEAMEAMFEGKEVKMTEAQAQEVMMKFLQEQQEKATAKRAEDAKVNLEKGEAFLKENATKEGVKTSASGLQYKITKEGEGKKPTKDDVVTVEYEGRLIDGTVFDSSKANGGPVSFPVSQVIPGWTEGIQLLKEGGEATLYIPAKLARGDGQVAPI